MKFGFQGLAFALAITQSLSACQAPSNPRTALVSNLSTAGGGGGVVRTAPNCSEEQGGRHSGETTPFSENPFSGCWPQ